MPSLNLNSGTSKFGRPPKFRTSKFRAKPAPLDVRSLANDYAERFYSAWRLTYENVIELGKICIEAAETLEGAELAKFKLLLPFKSWRTAERLMRIAEHPVLSDATHVSRLPSSWGTLYELSELPANVVEELIGKGRINSDMERSDADKIVKEYRELGIFSQEKFVKTLEQLIRFNEYPAAPVETMIGWLAHDGDEPLVYASDLAKLVPFITALSEGYRKELIRCDYDPWLEAPYVDDHPATDDEASTNEPSGDQQSDAAASADAPEPHDDGGHEQAEPADKPKSKRTRLKSRKARRASARAGM